MHTGRSGWRKRDADGFQRELPRVPWVSHVPSAPGHKDTRVPRPPHLLCPAHPASLPQRRGLFTLHHEIPARGSQSPLTPKRVTVTKPQHLRGLASEVTRHPPATFVHQQRVTTSSQLWRGRELNFLSLSKREFLDIFLDHDRDQHFLNWWCLSLAPVFASLSSLTCHILSSALPSPQRAPSRRNHLPRWKLPLPQFGHFLLALLAKFFEEGHLANCLTFSLPFQFVPETSSFLWKWFSEGLYTCFWNREEM